MTQAVKLLEEICFKDLGLSRIEIVMELDNKGSEKVAIKSGYKKEGQIQKLILNKDGTKRDCFLYAKTQ